MAKHVIQAVLELKDNFSGGLLSAAKQAKKSGANISNEMLKSTKKVQQWASNFGKAIDSAILKLGSLAVEAGKAFAALSFNTGMEFEKGLDKVQATASLTAEQMDALEKKAREVAGSTKFTLGETAEALYYMAMAGWGNAGTEKMEAALPHMVNLSIASDTDIGTVSDIVTDAMTALKMQADKTTTVVVDGVETQVNNVQHFADVLAKTSASANTNVDMMGESFKQAAALSGSMGYSIDDLAVALGVMANAGVKGESSGTALKNGITKLLSPTAKASALMAQYGVSLQNTDGTGKTLMQLMENLRSSFGDLDVEVLDASGELRDGETLLEELGEAGGVSAEQMAKIAAMSEIFGAKSLPGMLAMVQASEDDFSTLARQIDNCNGAAEEMAHTMGDNLAGDLDILSSTVGDAAWEFYKSIGGTAREAVQGLTAQIQKLKEDGTLQEWAQKAGEIVGAAFQKISEAFQWVCENADTLLTVFETLMALWAGSKIVTFGSQLFGVVNTLVNFGGTVAQIATTYLPALLSALGGLPLGPIAAAVAAVVAIGVALYQNWDAVKAKALELWNTLKTNLAPVIELVRGNAERGVALLTGSIIPAFQAIWNKVKELASAFMDAISPALTMVLGIFGQLADFVVSAIVPFLGDVIEVVSNLANAFMEIAGPAVSFLLDLLGVLADVFTGVIMPAVGLVIDVVLGLVNCLGSVLGPVLRVILDVLGGLAKALSELVVNAINALVKKATELKDFLAQKLQPVINGIKNAFNSVKEAVGGLVDKVKTFLGLNTKKTIEVDVAGNVGGNAKGTKHWKGGLTWVNELGGEVIRVPNAVPFVANRGKPALLNLPSGTQIIPHHALGTASFRGGDIPGGMITAAESTRDVTLNINIGSVSGSRSDAEYVAQVIYGKVIHALENLA